MRFIVNEKINGKNVAISYDSGEYLTHLVIEGLLESNANKKAAKQAENPILKLTEENYKEISDKENDEAYYSVYCWLENNKNYFNPNEYDLVRAVFYGQEPENAEISIKIIKLKKPSTIRIISIFFGWFGVDRFMLGQVKMGIIKLLTGGGVCFLWLYDIFTITSKVKTYNLNQVITCLNNFS